MNQAEIYDICKQATPQSHERRLFCYVLRNVVVSADGLDVRKIGNVDEGVVERGEDACDAEDELACTIN